MPNSIATSPSRFRPQRITNAAHYMARFERDAQIPAALKHPNIAQIHGVEGCALIMELVEGKAPSDPASCMTSHLTELTWFNKE